MSTNLPSFERAEYLPPPGTREFPAIDPCVLCKKEVAGTYYRVNGLMSCEACAKQVEPERLADNHKAFVQALVWGAGAAVLGMIGYATFTIVTGIFLAYIALGVGFLIGKAMKHGSGGRGGKRYQIAAAILTYAAVSVAAVPIALHQYAKHKPVQTAAATPNNQAAKDFPYPGDAPKPKPASMGPGKAIALLVALGLASPFLELAEGFHGVIGLIILFVGIGAAWRQTSGTDPNAPEIEGPYETSPA